MMTGLRAKAKLRGAALALSLTAMLGGSAQAAQLWYDGFSLTGDGGQYVVDTGVNGQTGGAGLFFSGAWQQGTNGNAVTSPSLDRVYDGTNTSALITPAVGGKVSAPLYDGGRSGIAFASPWGGFTAPVGTYYMSFLATFGSASPADGVGGHRVVEMYDGTLTDDNYRTLQLGYSIWSGLGDGQHLTLGVNGQNVQLSENVNFVQDQGTVHHLVLKFEMKETDFDPLTTDDNDVVSVYLDPVGTSEPGAPSALVSTEDFLASYLTTISKFAWVGGTEVGFDELRVATTFAEVANNLQPYVAQRIVPEPTSFVLLGLALLGLLGVRKK